MATRIFFHATVFKFTKEGVREVSELFDQADEDVTVRCIYSDETHIFRIECPPDIGEEAYFKFARICDEYIEKNTEYDVDKKSAKIIRMTETQVDGDGDIDLDMLLMDTETQDSALIDLSSQEESDGEDDPVWNPSDSHTNVTEVFPEKILQSIARDVNCELRIDEERACIVLPGADETVKQIASQKLYNIERNQYREKVFDLYMRVEKERDIKLEFRLMQDMPDKMMLRTLVPWKAAVQLHQMRKICMIRSGGSTGQIISANPPETAPDEGLLKAWTKLRHPQFNTSGSVAPLIDFEQVPVTPGDELQQEPQSIHEWLSGIHSLDEKQMAALPADELKAMQPTPAPFSQPSGVHQLSTEHLGFPEADMNNASNMAAVEGPVTSRPDLLIDISDSPEQSPTSISTPSVRDLLQLPQRVAQTPSHGQPPGRSLLSQGSGLVASQANESTRQPQIDEVPWQQIYVRGSTANTGNLIGDFEGESTGAQNASESLPFDWRKSDNLPRASKPDAPEAPAAQPRVVASQTVTPVIASTLQSPQFPQSENSFASLIQDSPEEDSDEEIVERLQPEEERESRIFYSSMNHRKGKGKAPANASKPAPATTSNLDMPDWIPGRGFIGGNGPASSRTRKPQEAPPKPLSLPDYSKSVINILEQGRSVRGELAIEIHIGRMLLTGFKKNDDARDFATSVLLPERMAVILQRHVSSNDVQPFFTRRLSTSIEEACLIPVPHLFEQEPKSVRIWYEFHCEDRDGNQLVIKTTGNNADVEASLHTNTIGSFLCVFPKRKWDARFVVKGRNTYPDLESISVFAKTVSATIREHAGSNPSELHRTIELQFRCFKDLAIKRVYAKSRMSHQCKKNDRVTLHVTEVQHVDDSEFCRHKKDTAIRGCRFDTRPAMIQNQALWFEAKLSISSHSSMAQNVDLGVGDDADWQPKEVFDDNLMSDVGQIVDQLVTRLDGVGVQNKGPRGDEQDLEALEAQRKERERSGRSRSFW